MTSGLFALLCLCGITITVFVAKVAKGGIIVLLPSQLLGLKSLTRLISKWTLIAVRAVFTSGVGGGSSGFTSTTTSAAAHHVGFTLRPYCGSVVVNAKDKCTDTITGRLLSVAIVDMKSCLSSYQGLNNLRTLGLRSYQGIDGRVVFARRTCPTISRRRSSRENFRCGRWCCA